MVPANSEKALKTLWSKEMNSRPPLLKALAEV